MGKEKQTAQFFQLAYLSSTANGFAVCMGIKMQNNKESSKFMFGMIIFMIGVMLTGCGRNSVSDRNIGARMVQTSESSDNSMEPVAPYKTTGYGIEVSMNYGFNHYAKFGRYMNIRVQVTAIEQDFKGLLQITVPEQSGNNVMYEEGIAAGIGETQNVIMDIPMNGSYNQFQYKVIGNHDEIVVEKNASVDYSANMNMEYIGVLSNQKEGLDYLQGADTKAFYLDESIITDDYIALDALDIIVISDYDIGNLSKSQCNAIKEWTKNGGTLVLSADSNAGTVFSEFLEDSLQEFGQEPVSSEITFKLNNESSLPVADVGNGVSGAGMPQDIDVVSYIQNLQHKSIEKDLYKIHLLDSQSVEIASGAMEEIELLQIVKKGLGSIQVFGFDIKLNEKNQETIGLKIVNDITSNLSKTKKQQLSNELNSNPYDYRLLSNLELTSNENLPRVAKYIVILLVYIVIAGPTVYIVLKKKDKRNLTWVVVPVVAAVFTIIVFWMGNSTRVKEPYIGYVILLDVEENGSAEQNTLFSVTSPYNKPYKLSFDSTYGISAIADRFSYGNNFYQEKANYSQYNTSISNTSRDTMVKIKNHSAFAPAYFTAKSKMTFNGRYGYDIYDTNDAVTGTFTNNLGYDLAHSAIMCNGVLIHIGELPDGQMVKLDELEREDIPTPESLYGLKLVDEIAGGKLDGSDTDAIRRHNILDSSIEKAVVGSAKSSFLIGFIEEDTTNELLDSLDYKTYGTKVITVPLDINQTKDGLTYINDLGSNMEVVGGYYDPTYRYISSDDLIVKYTFEPKDKVKSIRYSKRGNHEFYDEKQAGFQGDAYFYNDQTKEYDKIFTGGRAKEVTELSAYLNEKNELLMKVKVKKEAEGRFAVTLPMLTAVKEAD